MNLTENFTLEELTETRHGENTPMPEQIENLKLLATKVLQPLRNTVGQIVVSSGYRSERVNKIVGGSSTSQHCKGEAVDKYVNGGAQTLMFASAGTAMGGTAGYKEAQMSNIVDGNLVAGEYYYMVIFQNANGPNGGGRALGGSNTTKPYRNWTKAVGNLGEDGAGVAPATITEPTGETTNGNLWFLLKS